MQRRYRLITILYILIGFQILSYAATYFNDGNPLHFIVASIGIPLIILIFVITEQFAKIFLATIMCLILFSIVILTYTTLFLPSYTFSLQYDLAIVILIIYILIFIFSYKYREKSDLFLHGLIKYVRKKRNL